jgi:hypothetical protein
MTNGDRLEKFSLQIASCGERSFAFDYLATPPHKVCMDFFSHSRYFLLSEDGESKLVKLYIRRAYEREVQSV